MTNVHDAQKIFNNKFKQKDQKKTKCFKKFKKNGEGYVQDYIKLIIYSGLCSDKKFTKEVQRKMSEVHYAPKIFKYKFKEKRQNKLIKKKFNQKVHEKKNFKMDLRVSRQRR